MSRAVAWCLLVVWSAWGFALQGLVASNDALGVWTPDLGVCLLLALDPRLERRDALGAVGVVSAARIAFSSDPPLAILVGYAGLVVGVRRLRRGFEVDRPLPRALLAALAAAVLAGYWALTRRIALAADGLLAAQESLVGARLAHVALATAVCTTVLAPLLVRLPGLSPLWRRRR